MSASAKHRAAAEQEAAALARAVVTRLHEMPEPEHVLFTRFYELIRARQKLAFSVKEATGRLRTRDRHVNALLASMSSLHEQLVNVVAERDSLRQAAGRVA